MHAYAWSAKIVSACWILFLIVWAVSAFSTKRTIQHENGISRSRYISVLILGYVLIASARVFPYPLNVRLIPRTTSIGALAAALCIAGLLFAV